MKMCLMQGKTVSPDIAGICNRCSLYLSTCMPVVDHGYLFGECDNDYCCECPYYEDCGSYGEGVSTHEQFR